MIIWFTAALFSLDPRMGLENIWFPLTHLLIFFVMVDLLQSGQENLLIETQFLLAALVVFMAGIQLASWYFGWGFATSTVGWIDVIGADVPLPLASPRLFVPLGVSTWLAAYTAPLVILATAWGLSARRQAGRNALWVLAVLLVIIMLLTGSRGGWISLGAGAAVFLALQVLKNERWQKVIRRFAVLIAIGMIAAAAAGILVFTRISSDPGHASGDVLRFDLWRGAVQIARDHPVIGVGPGLFGRAYRLYRDPVYVDDRLGTAHNLYLNTLAETGIVGALIGAALGVILVRAWWRQWRSADTLARKLHLEGAFAALIGFGAHSFFDTFTSTPLVLLALGLTAYCVTAPRSRLDPPLTGSRPAAFASLIVVILFGVGLYRSDQAQAAFIVSVTNASLGQALEAQALDPALHLYTLQVAYLTGQEIANTSDTNPTAAIAAYQQALALEPTWDKGWINLAALYDRQGNTNEALDALQRAISINNRNGALLMWARLAPPDDIIDAYLRHLRLRDPGDLPLSAFWSETDARREALMQYAQEIPFDLRYRILAVHDPEARAALIPDAPITAEDWWVTGEYALTMQNDPAAAEAAFTEAIARSAGNLFRGDYYASRARARLITNPQGAERDLKIAELLGTYNEYPNAIRTQLAQSPQAARPLLAAAVPPRVIDQNFEGVLFAGRVASFDLLPEMHLPGPGHSVMQPWYALAENYLAAGQTDQAANVYRAIVDRAPDETDAREQLSRLIETQSP